MSIEVVTGAAPATDTTQDLTVSGFGTVQAAIIYTTTNLTLGTSAAHAVISAGMTDGTRERCIWTTSEDGVGTTDCRGGNATDRVVQIVTPGTDSVIRSATSAFITDGIRLTWAGGNTQQYQVMVILINEVDNAYVGHVLGNATSGSDVSTTDPGFTPDTLILPGFGRQTTADTGANGSTFSIGWAHDNGGITQRAAGFGDNNGNSTTASGNEIRTDRVGEGTNSLSGEASSELASFDANGFTLTTRDSSQVVMIPYVALDLTGWDVDVGHLTMPTTAAADWDETGIGFQPESLFLSTTIAHTIDSPLTDDVSGFGLGFSATTPGGEASWSISSDDNVVLGTTTCNSMMDSRGSIMDGGGTVDYDWSNLTFESDGWTVANADLDSVDTGTGRVWGYIAFKAPADGPAVPLVSPLPQRNRRSSGRFL